VIFHDLHTMIKDARDGAPLACGTWAMRAARWDMPAAEQERIIRAIEARKAAETWLEWL
jgi:hypothetical protein